MPPLPLLGAVPCLFGNNISLRHSCPLNHCDGLLQLSNAETLSAYLFGSRADARRLPIVRGFEAEVVGETAEQLRAIVTEHKGWLAGNCQRQIDSYRCDPCHAMRANGPCLRLSARWQAAAACAQLHDSMRCASMLHRSSI